MTWCLVGDDEGEAISRRTSHLTGKIPGNIHAGCNDSRQLLERWIDTKDRIRDEIEVAAGNVQLDRIVGCDRGRQQPEPGEVPQPRRAVEKIAGHYDPLLQMSDMRTVNPALQIANHLLRLGQRSNHRHGISALERSVERRFDRGEAFEPTFRICLPVIPRQICRHDADKGEEKPQEGPERKRRPAWQPGAISRTAGAHLPIVPQAIDRRRSNQEPALPTRRTDPDGWHRLHACERHHFTMELL
jgi:hypothetical protein